MRPVSFFVKMVYTLCPVAQGVVNTISGPEFSNRVYCTTVR